VQALFFCQEPQKADAMLAKAIELDKADTVAYYHAGQAAAQQGQQDRALELYNKVQSFGSMLATRRVRY
jgi:cytochrome c-type biogenesis protein CcmH/NrfG